MAVLIKSQHQKCAGSGVKNLLEDYWPTKENDKYIVPRTPNALVWTNYLNYDKTYYILLFEKS